MKAFGVLVQALVSKAQLAHDVFDVGLGCSKRFGQVGEAFVGRQLQKGTPEQVTCSKTTLGQGGIRAGQAIASLGHGQPERSDLGEHRLLGGKLGVFGLRGDVSGGDLVDLKAEQVDRSSKRPRIAAELDETGVDQGELTSCLGHRLEIGAGEGVEGVSLRRLVQQGLVGVLAVEIDQGFPDLRERRNGRHAAVHVGARTPGARNCPREHDLAIAVCKAPFDHRLSCARAHHGCVGPAADEQLECFDDEGLAGARLACERRHAGADDEIEVSYDPEVSHSQLDKHGRA